MNRYPNDRRLAPRMALFMALLMALSLAACDHDVDITAPQFPNPGPFPPDGNQTIQISGTLSTVQGGCLEATILYDGQELGGARNACDAPGGCTSLELVATAVPRIRGHHTIAFQVLDQSQPMVEYMAEGTVLLEMGSGFQGHGLEFDMALGPKHATLGAGESVTFDVTFM